MKETNRILIEDEFLATATPYEMDNKASFEGKWDTLGNVMRWMAAYDAEEYETINKGNFRTVHKDSSFAFAERYGESMIFGGGRLLMKGYRADGTEYRGGCGREYPSDTNFADIVADYAEEHWDDEVRVISYYSGAQGLLAITVYDKKRTIPLFSFGSLEMYGDWRAR